MNPTLFYTPRIEQTTGKPFGWIGIRPDRDQFVYVLDTSKLLPKFPWRRIAKTQVADTPMAIARGQTGATAQEAIDKMVTLDDPFWRVRASAHIKARAQLILIKANPDRITWPPFDPTFGETD